MDPGYVRGTDREHIGVHVQASIKYYYTNYYFLKLTHPTDIKFVSKMATFFKCIKYALKCVTDMVLYNICGRIFDPRLIDTDSRRMEQICNSYIVQICTDHIYDSEVLCIFVPKRREGPEERFQLGHKE